MVTVVSGGLFFFHGTGGSEEPLTQMKLLRYINIKTYLHFTFID